MTRLGLTPTSTTKAKTNAYAKATSSYKASKDHDQFKSNNKATKATKASKYNTLDFGEFEDAPQSSRRNLVRKDTRNTMSNRNSNRNSSRNSSSHGNGNSDRTKHRNNTYDNSRGYTKENTSDILMSNFKNPNVEQIRPRKKDNRDYQNNQDRQDTRNKKDKKNIKVVTNVVGAGYKKYAELKSLKESRPRLPKFAPVDFDADPDAEPVLPRAERRRLFAIQKREAEKKAAETDEQVKNGPPGKREMIIQAGPRESKRFGTERFFVMSKQDQENKELSKKNSKVELAKEDDESKKAKNQKKALVANDQFDDEIIDPVQDPENDVDFKDIKIAITATEKELVKQAVPTEQEIKDIVSRVLYHDKHILVLNKPFGLKVQRKR